MSKHYEPPIPFERLQELIAALESDRDLDRATRDAIKDGLDVLYVTQLIERDLATPGRRHSFMMASAAYLVHCLVSIHGVKVKAACIAVLPGAKDQKDIERLGRAYRKLKAKNNFREFMGDPRDHPDVETTSPGSRQLCWPHFRADQSRHLALGIRSQPRSGVAIPKCTPRQSRQAFREAR